MNNVKLKEIRKAKGMTQKELGELLKLSQNHISDLENGNKKINDRIIDTLILKLGINEDWLYSDTGDMFIDPVDSLDTDDEDIKDFVRKYMQLDDNFKKHIKGLIESTLNKEKEN